MVDGREKLADITLQHVRVAPGKFLRAIDCAVGALANPVGIAVMDEAPLPDRLDHLAQGMVDHPVSKRRSGDQAALRLMDVEAVVLPRLVGLALSVHLAAPGVLAPACVRRPPLLLCRVFRAGRPGMPGTGFQNQSSVDRDGGRFSPGSKLHAACHLPTTKPRPLAGDGEQGQNAGNRNQETKA